MKYLKRILLIVLSICGLVGIVSVAESKNTNLSLLSITQAEEPTILFRSKEVAVGQPLEVVALGYPWGTTFSYQWCVDGTPIDHSTNVYVPKTEDLQKFISVTVTSKEEGTSQTISVYVSSLPVFYLETADGEDIDSKEEYKVGTLFVQAGGETRTMGSDILYDGGMQIKGRGNSTWNNSDKKPYHLKLDVDADLLGLGYENDWTLLSNDFDPSLMRNATAYALSGKLGLTTLDTAWIDLVINGEYVGNYLLCEKMEVAETRVNITNWEQLASDAASLMTEAGMIALEKEEALKICLKENLAWLSSREFVFEGTTYTVPYYVQIPELTGGVLMELDMYYDEISKFRIENQHFMFNEPTYASTNKELFQYIKEYVGAFYYAAWDRYSDDHIIEYRGEQWHYSDFFDMDSLIAYYLVQEIYFNADGNAMSSFFYKDVGQQAHMGPIWDMDRGSGGLGITSYVFDQWQSEFYSMYDQCDQWYKGLVTDPYFLSQVMEFWQDHREEIFSLIEEGGDIDQAYEAIGSSGVADSVLWDGENTFDTAVLVFKTWMQLHLRWMDAQYASLDTLVESIGRFRYGLKSQLSWEGDHLILSCGTPEAVSAVFYWNGRVQTTVDMIDGKAVWEDAAQIWQAESDVIQVRIYDADGKQIATNYTDHRQPE